MPTKKLKRLVSMGPDEIITRLQQEIAKKLDARGLFLPTFNALSDAPTTQAGRFFFTAKEIPQRIQLIRENVPNFETNVLEQAEQILKHQFPLLGYGPLDIDWQLDIVSGKRAPYKPWPKISYLNFDEVGDCKVTWELSRHQFLITLAKAWLLTGDERYTKKLESIYYDWQKKNPYPLGINWASSLEVAFRSLSWIWVRELLGGCASASRLREDITKALGFNAWYIQRYLSTYFSPNTHLQGEAVALFFIGTLCPSLPEATRWRDLGWSILLEHALTKVHEDGAYFEQSTYYHVYALDFFLHAQVLAGRNGMPIPDNFDVILKRMLTYLSSLCQAGPPPRFGDDDGGRLFDGSRNRAEHLLDPLATGVALYKLNGFKLHGVQSTEEMLWLLGDAGLQALSGVAECKSGSSAAFSKTGLYVFHAGEGNRSQAVMDAGPLGGGSGGHGHADALSVTVNLDGKPMLIDPGACNYVGPGSDREDFRVTRAHNTIVVDGLSQAEPRTAFSWHRWPEVEVEANAFAPTFEFIAASHDGYAQLPSPVTHRRTLLTSNEGFWIVLDQLIANGPHEYTLQWHLMPDADVQTEANDEWIVERDGCRLRILTAAEGWSSSNESGLFSVAYGMKEHSPVLKMVKQGNGKEDLATVLWTATDAGTAPVFRAVAGQSGTSTYELAHGEIRWILIIGDGVSQLQFNGWESDAKIMYCKLDAHGSFARVSLIQSTFLRREGKTLHESATSLPYFGWGRNG